MTDVPASLTESLAVLPLGPGVYRFMDDLGRPLYIGRAVSLRRRVRSYFGSLRDRPRLRRMVAQIATLEAIECDSEHEAWWLERNLLERAKPRWNRARGGAEVPWFIRLDHRPDGAAVQPVHEVRPGADTEHFGPYLGGLRVRLAVASLDRLFPLRYASATLTGSSLEMARLRQVLPSDHGRLLTDLRAVLRRDRTPVHQALARLGSLRNEASERLAFESAARLQQEHEALRWISSEQKVTSLVPGTMTLWGCQDDIGVRLDIRNGVLDRWSIVSSSGPPPSAAGETSLPETPLHWGPFVDRAVRLAGLLRGQITPVQ